MVRVPQCDTQYLCLSLVARGLRRFVVCGIVATVAPLLVLSLLRAVCAMVLIVAAWGDDGGGVACCRDDGGGCGGCGLEIGGDDGNAVVKVKAAPMWR